jgi:hypothetical protein
VILKNKFTSVDGSVGNKVPAKFLVVGNGNGAREARDFSTWAIAQIRQFPLVGFGQVHVENWLRVCHLDEHFGFQLFKINLVVPRLNGLNNILKC